MLLCVKNNGNLLVSIFDFNTPIHMLRHIASYTCFIITIVTTIFFNFQNAILVSSKVSHSSCILLWVEHYVFNAQKWSEVHNIELASIAISVL